MIARRIIAASRRRIYQITGALSRNRTFPPGHIPPPPSGVVYYSPAPPAPMIMFRVRVRVEQDIFPLEHFPSAFRGGENVREGNVRGGICPRLRCAARVGPATGRIYSMEGAHQTATSRRHQRLPMHDTSPLHTTNTPQITRESNAELACIAAVVTATGPVRPSTVNVGPSPVQLVRQSGKHPIINHILFARIKKNWIHF